jgi:PAS domain S-box-containing protein
MVSRVGSAQLTEKFTNPQKIPPYSMGIHLGLTDMAAEHDLPAFAGNYARKTKAELIGELAALQNEVDQLASSLRKAEENHDLSQSAAREIFWDWSEATGILNTSPGAWDKLDLADLPHQSRLEDWMGVIHPDDVAQYRAILMAYVKGHTEHYEQEYRVRRKDGSYGWVHDRGLARRKPNGRVYRMAGAIGDITERKRAETLNTRLGRIIEDSANEIYVFDSTTFRFVMVNRGARENLGYSMEELAGLTPLDLKPEFTAEDFADAIAPLRAGSENTVTFSTVHRRKDGSTYPVNVRLQLARNETPPVFFAIITDVTEQRKREAALHEAVELQQSLLDHSPAVVAIRDIEGRFQLVNRTYERLFDVKRGDIEGKTLADVTPGEFAELVASFERTVIETGEPLSHEHDAAFARGRGTLLSVRFPLRDADGKITGVGTIGVDVTERTLTQQALQKAKEEAELANRSKSEFLANMSHELRTPLNGIIGFSEMMVAERLGPLGNPSYKAYARDIHESGTLLLCLIEDILDLSKIEAGRLELREEEVSIVEVVGACRRIIEARAIEAGLVLETRLPRDLPKLWVDARSFKQIVLNLLSNAVKFTPAGGRIAVDARIDEAGRFVVAVSDTGIGMAAKDIPTALTPFRQVESYLTRKHAGTGLGLPLVNSLAEAHDGNLTLESEPGVGTTATIAFPPERVIDGRTKIAGDSVDSGAAA